tara:strand:+ start:14411 stop:14605 length:195 start_codon:yes stop_codon:yes gene_type:complete
MSVEIGGGCEKCGRTIIKVIHNPYSNHPNDILYCDICYDKHYSIFAIREKKLRFLTKKWWQFWI